jgi:hypothetical protein
VEEQLFGVAWPILLLQSEALKGLVFQRGGTYKFFLGEIKLFS